MPGFVDWFGHITILLLEPKEHYLTRRSSCCVHSLAEKMRISHLFVLLLALLVPTSYAVKGGRVLPKKPGAKKKKSVKVKKGGCKKSKCQLDESDFDGFTEADEIDVQLTEDGPHKIFTKVNGDEKSSWFGDDGDATMNLITRANSDASSSNKDLVFGSVTDGDTVYHIAPDENGNPSVTAIPQQDFPPELEPLRDPEHEERRRELQKSIAENKQSMVASAGMSSNLRGVSDSDHRLLSDNGDVIDVMVVWTKLAECKNSGLGSSCSLTTTTKDNMLGLIALAIAETNTAYTLSGVDTELRLVHAYRHPDYEEVSGDAFSQALYGITYKNDGIMEDVHDKRTLYGADVVALLIHDDAYCGLGWVGPYHDRMFSVTAHSCATGYFSFGHEIGHNMGCLHDKGTASNGGNCPSGSMYGWRDPDAKFRTIMSYNCVSGQCDGNPGGGCARIQRFSTKDGSYNYYGDPIGDSGHDNAGQINSVRAEIAAYETTVSPCQNNGDCDDSDPCTTDTCDNGECVSTFSCPTPQPTAPPTPAPTPTPFPTRESDVNSLVTTWQTDNGSYGNMFNIQAVNSDIRINGFDIHTSSTGTVRAYVWTRPENYVTNNNDNKWIMIEDGAAVTGQGAGNPTPLPMLQNPVLVTKNSMQAFYITLDTQQILYTNGQTEGILFGETPHMRFFQGRGVGGFPFGGTFSPRIFNGIIHYNTVGVSDPPTVGPTAAPTKAPTFPPTAAPTKAPTSQPTAAPTKTPTSAPTATPTKAPTSPPTSASTVATTPQPTNVPTSEPTKAPTPVPTEAPTPVPTEAPTPVPTLEQLNIPIGPPPTEEVLNIPAGSPAPTPAPTTCEDDETWEFFTKKSKRKTCRYMDNNPDPIKIDKRCSKIGEDGRTGKEACPEACGVCTGSAATS